MKKILICVAKFLLFFTAWVLIVTLVPVPTHPNAAMQRLWYEVMPFAAILLLTFVFAKLVERGRIKVPVFRHLFKNIWVGLLAGCVWLGAAMGILLALGIAAFAGSSEVPLLWVWILAAFVNVCMQELLIRGYLYQLVKKEYGHIAALVATTALFTLMHAGAFEAGPVAVLNVVTMSIFVTLVLEYTRALLAPILIHAVWNIVGCIGLGAVSLAEDYLHVWHVLFSGSPLLSGGAYKLEGSIVVLFLNSAFILLFASLLRSKKRRKNVA